MYDDIIHLPHHVSRTRPQMSIQDRAAQFSPFAALTGYDAAVRETARLTEDRIQPDEEVLAELDRRFRQLVRCLEEHPEIRVTWFRPDRRKAGGSYVTTTDRVRKISLAERRLTLESGLELPMDEILTLEGALFEAEE